MTKFADQNLFCALKGCARHTPIYVQVLKNYMSMKNKLLGRNFDDLIL